MAEKACNSCPGAACPCIIIHHISLFLLRSLFSFFYFISFDNIQLKLSITPFFLITLHKSLRTKYHERTFLSGFFFPLPLLHFY